MKDQVEENDISFGQNLDIYMPPASAWSGIEKKLDTHQRRKKVIPFVWISLSSAAALCLLLYAGGVFENEPSDDLVQIETQIDSSFVLRSSDNFGYENIPWEVNQGIDYYESGPSNNNFDPGLAANVTYSLDVTLNAVSYGYTVPTYCDSTVNSHAWINGGYNTSYSSQKNAIPEYKGIGYYFEQYDHFEENKPETPLDAPLSTFGIDVDGAAYSNVRRFINSNYLPPKDAVKLEEMINYFDYDFEKPKDDVPFAISTELGKCPWDEDNLLMQVALQGKEIDFEKSQQNNLVFLIDVSGSMDEPNKLPLLKSSLKLMVEEMNAKDRIAIVVYAGSSGLVLPSTAGSEKTKIFDAIERLSAGGSTAGGEGIVLAYKVAVEQFVEGGNNRVLLATDGDFNVGISDDDALVELIEEKRETGVYLSVLGFGTENLQSSKMEKLADNGNGNYFYIDNIMEAKKVLVNEIGGTMITIAKDVKLQVEFNPEEVKYYRLLGYENRILQARDFDDDTKDAGDLGAGHNVIALYEIVPQDKSTNEIVARDLRYQTHSISHSAEIENELAIIKFRYKDADSKVSKLLERIIPPDIKSSNSSDFLFASAVAEFGLLLRESKYRGTASFDKILQRAKENIGKDTFGYRKEFIDLVEKAKGLVERYRNVSGL